MPEQLACLIIRQYWVERKLRRDLPEEAGPANVLIKIGDLTSYYVSAEGNLVVLTGPRIGSGSAHLHLAATGQFS